jgi:hypothetical protein
MRVTFAAAQADPEMLAQLREDVKWAQAEMAAHLVGEGVDPDKYAAANTLDEVFAIPGLMPAGWKDLKSEYYQENSDWADLVKHAQRLVRVATGHEPIGKMVIR